MNIIVPIQKILVVDPALTSGHNIITIENTTPLPETFSYSELVNKVVKSNNFRCKISSYGYVIVPPSLRSQDSGTGKVCNYVYEKYKKIIIDNDIDHLAIENYYFSKRAATGSTINVSIRTALYMLAEDMGLSYTVIEINDWKRRVSGRVRPNASDKKKYGKNAKEMFIKSSLEDEWGISFPEKFRNEKGREVNFKFDICAAIGQAIAFCMNTYKVGKSAIFFDPVSISRFS